VSHHLDEKPLKNRLKLLFLLFLLDIIYTHFHFCLLKGVFGMPIYEYECGTCGGRFEEAQKFSDPLVTECKLCKAPNVRKLLSPTSFVLKGSGWYATDYATTDKKKSGEPEKQKEAATPGRGCSGGACASGACPSKG
jgi:putative FmdB family regulatory protein